MNKNTQNRFQFLLLDTFGYGRTGLSPTVKISKDGGAFASTTNSASQVDSTNAPGLYQVILTATECACDVLAIAVTFANGDMPAVLERVELEDADLMQKAYGLLGSWSLSGTTLTTTVGETTRTYTLTKAGSQITAISENVDDEEDEEEE